MEDEPDTVIVVTYLWSQAPLLSYVQQSVSLG